MVRLCVWSRNFVNEEAMAHWGLSRQKKKNKQMMNTDEAKRVMKGIQL